VDALCASGRAAVRAGLYQDAVQAYCEAVADAPNDSPLRLQRSQAYLKLRKYKEAAADATVCTQLTPKVWKGWNCLGLAHIQLCNFSEAQQAFMRGLALDPRNTEMAKNYSRAASMAVAMSSKPKATVQIRQSVSTDERKPVMPKSGPAPEVVTLMAELNTHAPSAMSTEQATSELDEDYEALTHTIVCQREYLVCAPSVLRTSIALKSGHLGSALAVGTKVVGRTVRADASGAVQVGVGGLENPLSAQMAGCSGEFKLDFAQWAETSRDFTRAFVAGAGDMMILVAGKHAAPEPIHSTSTATGNVNEVGIIGPALCMFCRPLH
jgi:hypothetical protein